MRLLGLTHIIKQFVSIVFVMIVGLISGTILFKLSVPIPFLLGSVLIIIFANKVSIKIQKPSVAISRWMRVIIGVTLGHSTAGNLNLFSWSTSFIILLAILFTIVITFTGMWFFRPLKGFNKRDLYISSLPGGLSFLISLAGDLGDKFPKIALIHATRIITLVFVLSLMAYFLGVESMTKVNADPFALIVSFDLWTILATIIVAGAIAEIFKIPGGQVIVGLVLSHIAYSIGFIQIAMPEMMITIAMTYLGILLGTSLMQGTNVQYSIIMSMSVAFTLIALMIGILISFGVVQSVDERFLLYFLALSPGGIAEISLITLALGLDVSLVVAVHASRFFFIVLIGSIGMNFLKNEVTKTTDKE